MSRKRKFATLVEILIDLILKVLYKANKNKKVKVKSPDTEEKDNSNFKVFLVWSLHQSAMKTKSGSLVV